MTAKIGSLNVDLTLETARFSKGLTAAQKQLAASTKSFEALGDRVSGLGKTLSIGLTAPLAAFGVTAVKAAMESQDALGQVDAALKSMGTSAGRTSDQLQGLASGIMRQSLFDDDDILRKVTANLLTFGNVAGEQFDRAQQAAVDLAARMGTDLQSATILVGKALNDPVKGLGALKKAGIQFTDQQKDQITAMVAAGDAAGAQSIMLKELERQFGGSAKAARDANPLAAMQQSFADFQETVGAKLLPLLPRITEAVTGVLDAFGKLSPGMQTGVIAFAGIAAAIGPVLIGVGAMVSAMAPFLAAVSAVFASGGILAAGQAALVGLGAAFGPVTIAIAAAAAAGLLIYQNWDKIAPVLQGLWQTIQTTIGPPLMNLIDALKTAFAELWNGPLGSAIKAVMPILGQLGSIVLSVFGQTVVNAIKVFGAIVGATFESVAATVRFITALFDGTFKNIIINAVKAVYDGVKNWLGSKLDAVWDNLKAKVEAATGFFRTMWDKVVGNSYVPDMVTAIASEMKKLDTVMVGQAKSATAKTTAAFKKMADDLKPLMERLFPEAAAKNALDYDARVWDKGRTDGKSSYSLWAEGTERLNQQRFDAMPANDNSGIPAGIAGLDMAPFADMKLKMEGLSAAVAASIPNLQGLSGTLMQIGFDGEEVRADLSSAFTDIVLRSRNAKEALGSVFDRLASKLLDKGFDSLLGGLFGGIGKIFGFATGTPSAPSGLHLVGERGPELVDFRGGERVIPNGSSRMGGSTNVTVEIVDTTGLFITRVNGQIAQFSPAIADAGGRVGANNLRKSSRRSLAA